MYRRRVGKKLKDAAEYYYGGTKTGVSEKLIQELRDKGAPDEVIEQYEARRRKDDFYVYPENETAVRLFSRLSSQWHRAGMTALRTGLNYPAVEVTARALGIELSEDVFLRLQILEQEALRIFNE